MTETVATDRRPWVHPMAPHFIVVRTSKRDHPLKQTRENAIYFRHPTAEAASAEAQRLAALFPGNRFCVYASCDSFKMESKAEESVVTNPEAP